MNHHIFFAFAALFAGGPYSYQIPTFHRFDYPVGRNQRQKRTAARRRKG